MSYNRVVEGDYYGYEVKVAYSGNVTLEDESRFFDSVVKIDWNTIAAYKIEYKGTRQKEKGSVARGLIGGLLLGPLGFIAGAPGEETAYGIALYFVDGKRCGIEVDESIKNAIERVLK